MIMVNKTVSNDEERRKIFFNNYHRMVHIDAECLHLAEKDKYDEISKLEDEQRRLLIGCLYASQYIDYTDDTIDAYLHWKINTLW